MANLQDTTYRISYRILSTANNELVFDKVRFLKTLRSLKIKFKIIVHTTQSEFENATKLLRLEAAFRQSRHKKCATVVIVLKNLKTERLP